MRTGVSRLVLPVRRAAESDERPLRPFAGPEGAPPIPTTALEPGEQAWNVTRDLIGYRSTLEIVKDGGVLRYDDIDLTTARGEVEWSMTFRRGDWNTRTVTRSELSCTPTTFEVYARLDVFEGDHRVFCRNWERSIPRDGV